jgi:hypothetical protein
MATRYQRGNQNLYIEEELTTQWPQDTKGVIRIRISSFSIYRFWLPLWYLVAIVLSVLLRYTDSNYPFGIFWSLCCQFFFDIRILITPLVSCGHYVVCSSSICGSWLSLWYIMTIVSSALLRYTDSDYPFCIFWPLCRLLFFDIEILITPLVSFGHCIVS